MIVDDHALLRSGLRMLVDGQHDMKVVGEAGTLHEAIEAVPKLAPDIITLDLSMPGASGVASVERLRAVSPSSRIVIVTMHDDPAYVRTAVAMGASGYVVKSAADTELIAAIRAVSRGRVFIDCGKQSTLDSVLSPKAKPTIPADTLSEREREVLQAVANGYTNQQIGDRLALSVKTVESYRARLMKKLGLKERADLVRMAIEMGLLSGERG
jgi:two-component system response regulator NreC